MLEVLDCGWLRAEPPSEADATRLTILELDYLRMEKQICGVWVFISVLLFGNCEIISVKRTGGYSTKQTCCSLLKLPF